MSHRTALVVAGSCRQHVSGWLQQPERMGGGFGQESGRCTGSETGEGKLRRQAVHFSTSCVVVYNEILFVCVMWGYWCPMVASAWQGERAEPPAGK